jgi:hypothetical protein
MKELDPRAQRSRELYALHECGRGLCLGVLDRDENATDGAHVQISDV